MEIILNCPKCGRENMARVSKNSPKEPACSYCKTILFRYAPVKGYIYVLSNSMYPGYLKIGFTKRFPEERVAELNAQTGVPQPFTLEAHIASEEPEVHE